MFCDLIFADSTYFLEGSYVRFAMHFKIAIVINLTINLEQKEVFWYDKTVYFDGFTNGYAVYFFEDKRKLRVESKYKFWVILTLFKDGRVKLRGGKGSGKIIRLNTHFR